MLASLQNVESGDITKRKGSKLLHLVCRAHTFPLFLVPSEQIKCKKKVVEVLRMV